MPGFFSGDQLDLLHYSEINKHVVYIKNRFNFKNIEPCGDFMLLYELVDQSLVELYNDSNDMVDHCSLIIVSATQEQQIHHVKEKHHLKMFEKMRTMSDIILITLERFIEKTKCSDKKLEGDDLFLFQQVLTFYGHYKNDLEVFIDYAKTINLMVPAPNENIKQQPKKWNIQSVLCVSAFVVLISVCHFNPAKK